MGKQGKKTLFERLVAGFDEGIEHLRGTAKLRVTQVRVPEPPPRYSAEDVHRVRESLHMSQAAFAALLAVSPRAVQSWEQGDRTPGPGTSRLLQFIEHPDTLTFWSSPRAGSGKGRQKAAR